MARRKRELLDLLRKQESDRQRSSSRERNQENRKAPAKPAKVEKAVSGGKSGGGESSSSGRKEGEAGRRRRRRQPTPATSPGESRRQQPKAVAPSQGDPAQTQAQPEGDESLPVFPTARPSGSGRFPWLPLLILGVAVPFIWWLGSQFEGKDGNGGGGRPDGPGQGQEGGPAGAGAENQGAYGVLAITYPYNDRSLELAQRTASALMREFEVPVQLLKVPGDRPTHYQIWVGNGARAEDLYDLRDRIREHELVTNPGEKDFKDAYIRKLPLIQ
ncbi:MAG: hypothetical protein DWQ01_13830 [Planctomycetota bacterium]|nr:MAG: hypothetical protein DWQ01_13830 [Planctomycetota bacterium]